MERIKPVVNEIYHIYNRGVEKRKIFLNEEDYLRFIHNLFEFNDEAPALNLAYYLKQSKEVGLPKIERSARKLLVELMVFCLMPNHFHLIMKQKRDCGVTEFMRKLGTGYTNYFNQKYKRVGPLFQGKYKLVRITTDSHFIHLPYYIHLNPLELESPKWKNKEIKNYKVAMKFLENYKWSSFSDYVGKKNFPSVTQREFLMRFFSGPENYKKETVQWLKEMDLEEFKEFTLEN